MWLLRLVCVLVFSFTGLNAPPNYHAVGVEIEIPPPPTRGLNEPRGTMPISITVADPTPLLSPIDVLAGQPLRVWRRGLERYATREIDTNCKLQRSPIWCIGLTNEGHVLSEYAMRQVEIRARAQYTYSTDIEDSWRVHTHTVYAGVAWTGDCDDLTSTVLDMMGREGQPMNKMWFILVNVDRSAMTADHIIGVVEDRDGKIWVVGDTGPFARPLQDVTYRILAWARLDRPKVWNTSVMLGEAGYIDAMRSQP
jgi:hypothetical protein